MTTAAHSTPPLMPLFALPVPGLPVPAPSPLDAAVAALAEGAHLALMQEKAEWLGTGGSMPGWQSRLMHEAAAVLVTRDEIPEAEALADVSAEVTQYQDPTPVLEWLVVTARALTLAHFASPELFA